MTDPAAALAHLQSLTRFKVRQRITPLVNRYEIRVWNPDDSDGEIVALAQQKRLALKEQVTFYADEDRTVPLFGFKSRNVMDIKGTTDIVDGNGAPLGSFRKDFAASLLRSTWYLEQPGLPPAKGEESNMAVALLRRFAVEWLPFNFTFTGPGGEPVMQVDKKFSLVRDAYRVTLHTPALDRRLAAAMAVALDALQGR